MGNPLSMFGTSAAAGGEGEFEQNIVLGNYAYLRTSSAVLAATGNSNRFGFVAWCRFPPVAAGITVPIFTCGRTTASSSQTIRVQVNNAGTTSATVTVTLKNNDVGTVTTTAFDSTKLFCILAGKDSNTLFRVFIDNTFRGNSSAVNTSMQFADTNQLAVNGFFYNSNRRYMEMGNIWFLSGYNFDPNSQRGLFIDAEGNPVDLGENGEIPTGGIPDVYMGDRQKAADWNAGNNLGNGTPALTITGGPYADDLPETYVPLYVGASDVTDFISDAVYGAGAATRFKLSCWMNITDDDAEFLAIGTPSGELFAGADPFLFVEGGGARSATGTPTVLGRIHIFIDYDSARPAPGPPLRALMYVNGAQVTYAGFSSSPAGGWDKANIIHFLAGYTGGSIFTTQVSEFWFDEDPSDLAQLGDFLGGKYAKDLGPNGELPMGTAPFAYFGAQQVAADWTAGTNLGTGGLFSPVGGVFKDLYAGFQNRVLSNEGTIRTANAFWKGGTSNQFIMSMWVKTDSADSIIMATGTQTGGPAGNRRMDVRTDSLGTSLTVYLDDGGGDISTGEGGAWLTDVVNIIIARSGTTMQVAVNDVVLSMSNQPNADPQDFTEMSAVCLGTDVRRSQNTSFVNTWGNFWFYTGEYLDLTVEANRRLFIGADLLPVPLGANGELPLGTVPDIFYGDDQTAVGWNNGDNLGASFGTYDLDGGPFTDL